MRRLLWTAVALAPLLMGGSAAVMAQGYEDGGPGYHRPPPPPDDDGPGYRRPPPDDEGYGYRRRHPPRFGDDGPGPLVCRTEEGSCRGRGPQIFRRRCLCDFGDGPVPGRLKP